MKRMIQVIAVLSVISIVLVLPVSAATSQNLEWSISLGDRFEFTWIGDYVDDQVSEGLYLNITAMPSEAIDDPLLTWDEIPEPDIGFFWSNATDMELTALVFLGLAMIGSKIALPIGNWTLMEHLVSLELTGEEIVDTANTWGIAWDFDANATHEYRIIGTYSKVDGFLAEYSVENWDTTGNIRVESTTVNRNTIPSTGLDLNSILQLIQDNILLVGAGIVILILVVVVLKKK